MKILETADPAGAGPFRGRAGSTGSENSENCENSENSENRANRANRADQISPNFDQPQELD